MTVLLEQLINGLALAGVYLLIALGATLIFGITRLVFFALGELVTLGAFLAYTLVQLNVPVVAAMVISAIVVGLFGELIDLGLLRRTMVRPLTGFIVSLGLVIALEAFYAVRWGDGDYYTITPILSGTWTLGDLSVNLERVVLVAITLVATAILFYFLDRTHFGRGLRALAEDRVSAQTLGVRVGPMISLVFMIGCALAALAGGLLGTIYPFTAAFGAQFLLQGFAVALVGGLGNVRGAVVAAVVLALAQTMGAAYISVSWSYAMFLATMVVIILIRPYGLIAGTGRGADPLGTSILGQVPAATATISTASPVGKVLAALPRLSFVVLIIVGLAVPFFIGSYRHVALATFALVTAIAGYTVWFGFRFAGIFSNAQASFVGWGAYATAVVTLKWGVAFVFQILAATFMGAVGAGIFGFIALRASGSYFVIVLFALSELQQVILQNWSSVTGGYYGIVLPTPANPLFGLVDFSDPVNLYYLVFVFACLVIAFLHWLSGTGFGKILTTVRDNDVLAQSLGLNTFRYRLATLIISGACAGLGGALYIFTIVGVQPVFFGSLIAIQLILMMILGGIDSLFGPLVGAVVATFLPEVLQINSSQAQVLYGLLLVAVIFLLPAGIVGTLKVQYMKYAARLAARYEPKEPPAYASAAHRP